MSATTPHIAHPSIWDTLSLRGERKDLATDLYSYKIGPTGSSFGMDVPMVGDLSVDESTMSLWIPIADGNRRDGVGDLLEVTGINTSRHVKNAIVLFDHGKEVTKPIARAREVPQDIDSYTFKINAADKTAGCRAYFYQGQNDCGLQGTCQPGTHGQFCAELFDMAAKGFVGAGSIGYQVLDGDHLPPDYQTGLPQGLHLRKVLLLECSLVVLPANADTVAKNSKFLGTLDYIKKALTGGRINGRQPSTHFIKSFASYMPGKQTTVVSGFKGMVHGPQCKCAKCMKQYGKKDHACGCKDCSQGKACGCEMKSKSLKDLRAKYRKVGAVGTKDEGTSGSSGAPKQPKAPATSQRRSATISGGGSGTSPGRPGTPTPTPPVAQHAPPHKQGQAAPAAIPVGQPQVRPGDQSGPGKLSPGVVEITPEMAERQRQTDAAHRAREQEKHRQYQQQQAGQAQGAAASPPQQNTPYEAFMEEGRQARPGENVPELTEANVLPESEWEGYKQRGERAVRYLENFDRTLSSPEAAQYALRYKNPQEFAGPLAERFANAALQRVTRKTGGRLTPSNQQFINQLRDMAYQYAVRFWQRTHRQQRPGKSFSKSLKDLKNKYRVGVKTEGTQGSQGSKPSQGGAGSSSQAKKPRMLSRLAGPAMALGGGLGVFGGSVYNAVNRYQEAHQPAAQVQQAQPAPQRAQVQQPVAQAPVPTQQTVQQVPAPEERPVEMGAPEPTQPGRPQLAAGGPHSPQFDDFPAQETSTGAQQQLEQLSQEQTTAQLRKEREEAYQQEREQMLADQAERAQRVQEARELGIPPRRLQEFEEYANRVEGRGGTWFRQLPKAEQGRAFLNWAKRTGKSFDPLAWDRKSLKFLKGKYKGGVGNPQQDCPEVVGEILEVELI